MKRLSIAILIILAGLFALAYRPSVSLDKLKEKYTDERSFFMDIDGLDVHYRKSGSGYPLLLIHGTSSSLHTWHYWQDILDDHFTVYSMDLPGCGLTGPNDGNNYSMNTFLEFLDAFTEELGLDSFHIAGNSLGGHISWEYARVNPRVTKAVLVDPGGYYLEDRELPLVFQLGQKKAFATIVEGLNVRPLIKKSLTEVYHDDDQVDAELVRRYTDLLRRKGNRLAFIRKVGFFEESPESELAEINCPVLVQWGMEDAWIPAELVEIYKRNLRDGQYILYENCGHVPQEEIPELSADDVLAFLLETDSQDQP